MLNDLKEKCQNCKKTFETDKINTAKDTFLNRSVFSAITQLPKSEFLLFSEIFIFDIRISGMFKLQVLFHFKFPFF